MLFKTAKSLKNRIHLNPSKTALILTSYISICYSVYMHDVWLHSCVVTQRKHLSTLVLDVASAMETLSIKGHQHARFLN